MAVPSAEPDRRPRRTGLTRRAAILAVAVAAVLLSLALPLRGFLAQRGEIDDLRRQNAAAKVRVASAEEQNRRWQDPAYVREQARQRLHYLLPGERSYVIVGDAEGTPSR